MKKRRTVIILLCIAAMALVGGTFAAIRTSTRTEHSVSTRDLGIEIRQEGEGMPIDGFGDGEDIAGLRYGGCPGDTIEEKVWVENTKAEDCYIRVVATRSWMKENAGGDYEKIFHENIDPEQIQLASNDSWYVMEDPDDSEVIYFYYKKMVPSGSQTTALVDKITLMGANNSNSNAYADLSANVIFRAEAVQAYDARNAMLTQWGIEADATVFTEPEEQTKTGTVEYLGNTEKFVTNVSGDEFDGIRPGESRTMTLTVANQDSQSHKFYISGEILDNIAASGDKKAVYDFIMARNGEVFFQAVISGDSQRNMISGGQYLTEDNKILLDTLSKGQKDELSITLTLDGESTGNSYQNQKGRIVLTFGVEDTDKTSVINNPGKVIEKSVRYIEGVGKKIAKTVKTGDSLPIAIMIMAVVSLLAVIILLLLKNRSRKETEQ